MTLAEKENILTNAKSSVLENEAKKYVKILGYNYNSSKWFEQTYIILNKDYKLQKTNEDNDKENFLKRIIKRIR